MYIKYLEMINNSEKRKRKVLNILKENNILLITKTN